MRLQRRQMNIEYWLLVIMEFRIITKFNTSDLYQLFSEADKDEEAKS